MNELSTDQEKFLKKLKSNKYSGQANNGLFIKELGWDSDKYWEVRNSLLELGLVGKAKGGPGGKTIIIEDASEEQTKNDEKPEKLKESDLYKPIKVQLEKNWIKEEKSYYQSQVNICASLGSKNTGGKWSRPDIAIIGVRKFKFISSAVVDVVSFEIKKKYDISVEAVFEALSHRQRSNIAYVIFHATETEFEEAAESSRIIALAAQHGVGVITAADPDDFFTWTDQVVAQRWEADPADLNDFIEQCFPPDVHDKILNMVK